MKFFCLAASLAITSTVYATEIREGPKLIKGSSFIIDCKENIEFIAFLNKNMAIIQECLFTRQRRGLLDEVQEFLLRVFPDEVVGVATLDCYNRYRAQVELEYENQSDITDKQNRYRIKDIENRKRRIASNIIRDLYIREDECSMSFNDKTIHANNVLMSRLPMIGFKFLQYKKLSIDGTGISETKLYAARLIRSYEKVICPEIEYYQYLKECGPYRNYVFKTLDRTPLSAADRKFIPVSNVISYCFCNEGVLEFREKYYREFIKNIWDAMDRLVCEEYISKKCNIIQNGQPAIIDDIIDLIIIDYYNRYYVPWWSRVEDKTNVDEEIRYDIREIDLFDFSTLELQEIVLSKIPLNAFEFFGRKVILSPNMGISEADASVIMTITKVTIVIVMPEDGLAQ